MSERRVIFSNYSLATRHGTESFLWDVTRRLQQRGTQCGIVSPRLGPLAEKFRAAGIAVWDDPRTIDWEPDVLHCHHLAETVRLLQRFPDTPALFMVHEPRLWQGLAPVTPQIRRYIAVDQLCRERLVRDCHFKEDTIQIIPNGVDLERFLARAALPSKPQRALIFTSGAAHCEHVKLAKKVCATLGIHLDEAGHATGKMIEDPENLLPHYDLVFGKARCALEALSVGCAVVLIGPEGVGEMVTSSRFDHFRAMNFGMGLLSFPLTGEVLLNQIRRYDPDDAALVTRRVRAECGVEHTVAALETLHAELAALKGSVIPGSGIIPLKAAAQMAEALTKEAITLIQTTSDLELERNRAEHYRSKVQELRNRVQRKQKTAADPAQPSGPLSLFKRIRNTCRLPWRARPVFHGKPPPMPFIVGSPRSGTTLLRLMLDAHPELAIPPETGFIAPLIGAGRGNHGDCESFWKLLTGHPNSKASPWPDFHLKKQLLRDALEKLDPFDPAEGLRVFYRLYASRFKKSRYGDKTPLYARHLTGIEALLPEARFIHLVRDGRDAAVSLRKLWFSPGNTMTEQASFWSDNVLAAREQGRQVKHYLEVSYEKLVLNPEQVLRGICDFIELPYSKQMLNYHRQAQDRINEHAGRTDKEGGVILSKEARLQQQANSGKAPMPGLIGKWRSELTDSEVQEFETVAGEALRLFGYPTGDQETDRD